MNITFFNGTAPHYLQTFLMTQYQENLLYQIDFHKILLLLLVELDELLMVPKHTLCAPPQVFFVKIDLISDFIIIIHR